MSKSAIATGQPRRNGDPAVLVPVGAIAYTRLLPEDPTPELRDHEAIEILGRHIRARRCTPRRRRRRRPAAQRR